MLLLFSSSRVRLIFTFYKERDNGPNSTDPKINDIDDVGQLSPSVRLVEQLASHDGKGD